MVKRLGISIFILISIVALFYGFQIPTQKVIDFAVHLKESPYSLSLFVIWTVVVCFVIVPLGLSQNCFPVGFLDFPVGS
jgi:hypothetical protein